MCCRFGGTVLHFAAGMARSIATTKVIINHLTTNVDAVDRKYQTALHLARGITDVVRGIISRSEARLCKPNGFTPSQLSSGGHIDVVKEVLRLSTASINLQDDNNQTPLHLAISGGHENVARAFFSHCNPSVDLQDNNKQTALHLCSIQGNAELVKHILEIKTDRDRPTQPQLCLDPRPTKGNTPPFFMEWQTRNQMLFSFSILAHEKDWQVSGKQSFGKYHTIMQIRKNLRTRYLRN